MRVHKTSISAGLVMLALTACSSSAEPAGIVHVQADYPVYDTAGLFEEATLIAEGVALAREHTLIEPRYEGDDPEENPLAGLSEEEQQRAREGAVEVVATVVTFRVDVVHRGQVEPGQEITVIQTGGAIDGVAYEVAAEVPLAVGESYLLFARDGLDGAFAILGGSAGTYVGAGDGEFEAAHPDLAPASQFTSAEVAALT